MPSEMIERVMAIVNEATDEASLGFGLPPSDVAARIEAVISELIPTIYDVSEHRMRPVTKVDLDRMQCVIRAWGELQNQMRAIRKTLRSDVQRYSAEPLPEWEAI